MDNTEFKQKVEVNINLISNDHGPEIAAALNKALAPIVEEIDTLQETVVKLTEKLAAHGIDTGTGDTVGGGAGDTVVGGEGDTVVGGEGDTIVGGEA